jgi:organic hydroperoxide reductase OsmC/OhrA
MIATTERLTRPAPRVEPFPHHYELSVTATADGQARLSALPRPDIVGGPPPQFGGLEESWSPEHLLLGAVSLCLLTTFKALADATGVRPISYSSRVKGILDRISDGLAFTLIVLDVDVRVPDAQAQAANELLLKAHRLCIVSRALKPSVELRMTVVAG